MKLRRPNKVELLSRCSFGSWITIPHPSVAEILARAGFDWLTVDLEHSAISIETAGELIRTIDLAGVTPLVRVGSHDSNVIKRVMDAGAHGIIASTVNSAEQAAAIVSAVKYPPAGTRGVGLSRAQGYADEFDAHYRWLNEDSLVLVQIEHIEAVRNIDAILSVPGVDGFFIGPYDLSASMGIPGNFDDPRMVDAIAAVKAAQGRTRKIAGIHVVQPSTVEARRKIADGFRFIAFGIDYLFMLNGSRAGLDDLRQSP